MRCASQELGPAGGIGISVAERCELHEAEGEIALAPIAAPIGDHRGKQRAVLIREADIALALVPNYAADRKGNQRGDHAIVQTRVFAVGQRFQGRVAFQRLAAGRNSADVPPHEVWIRPIGTFRSLHNCRPKK